MPGFGSQPFGSSPYGIGTPASVSGPTGKLLQNPTTGAQTGSRRIDPATKDYAFGDSGRVEGMSDTQQLVYLALATKRKSSTLRKLGQTLHKIKVVTGGVSLAVRNDVGNALAELVAQKRITLDDVRVIPRHPGAHVVRVFWTDLIDGREYQTET